MLPKNLKTIPCPYCKCEYLPAEIYIPDVFIGTPHNIQKSDDGKILGYDGTSSNFSEYYTCDKCNKQFRVVARILFNSYKLDSILVEPYVQNLDGKEAELTLEE